MTPISNEPIDANSEPQNVDAPIPSPDNDDYSRCHKCGAKYRVGVEYCPACGIRLRGASPGAAGIASIALLTIGAVLFGSLGACALLSVVYSVWAYGDFGDLLLIMLPVFAIGAWLAILCLKKIRDILRH